MPCPAFSDIGKAPKDLLAGGKATGTFQFDNKLSISSATTSGVAFTTSLVQKADRLDYALKAAYATKKYSIDAAIDPSSKVTVSATLSDVAPGLKLSSNVKLEDGPASAVLGLEYAMPYLALKSAVGLTATPVLDVAASTGYQNIVLGGEASFDTATSKLNKYNFALGYHAADFQVAAALADKLGTVKVSYSHNLTPTTTVGAEVVRKLADSNTTFALAYARKLSTGALTKVKMDGSGLLSALYETRLASGEKVTGSVQLQSTDLSKPIKYGFALDLA